MERRANLPGRALSRAAAGLLACAAALIGCTPGTDSTAHAVAALHPKVTVAEPLLATVTEFSEHTGRTEAPETVEVRARAAGHLARVAFREGEPVKKGELLFVIDPRPYQTALARAKADLASIRVDRELALKNLQRAEQLREAGTIPEREWDTRSSAAQLLAAREEVARAALASAQLELEYAYVRSPIDGRIGRTFVTQGNLIGPNTASPLATIVSVDPLYVYVDVDERRGLSLARRRGAEALVGFPGEEGYPHTANIDFVDNRVDPTTGTIRVRAVVKNPDGQLTHGLFARVRLSESEAHEALLVADRAVGTDQDRRFVWVVGADQKAQYRAVTLGPLEQGLRVVRAGLERSDRVIVRGLQRVRAGVEVEPRPIAMRELEGAQQRGASR